ncbi:MAG TPA: alpha/beta fold hydrolase [Terriglobia bacterium]|nr:alpha/beta fold hydrolase [Terriglobia bacterium]
MATMISRAAGRLFIAAILCGWAVPSSAQQLKYASLGTFQLENGQAIQNLRIAYRTFGTLDSGKSNAVVFPTWFTGTTKDLVQYVGPGKMVDSSRYYVILVDALGDGNSSSPSNSKLQPRMKFPEFNIRDMVKSEHALLTRALGLSHVHAVMGISMGGMQTFQWMVSYPGFMDEAIPIVGSPRLTSYDLLLWTAELHAIQSAADWNHGKYTSPPVEAMDTVADIHTLNLTTPAYLASHTSRAEFPKFIADKQKATMEGFDANNWIRQLQAMVADDVSKPFGGSMEKAAAAVRAKVLVVPSLQDHMVNPQPALEFAKLIHARVLKLTSDCGHIATGCELSKLEQGVNAFLAQ